jgi:hypothetical protein
VLEWKVLWPAVRVARRTLARRACCNGDPTQSMGSRRRVALNPPILSFRTDVRNLPCIGMRGADKQTFAPSRRCSVSHFVFGSQRDPALRTPTSGRFAVRGLYCKRRWHGHILHAHYRPRVYYTLWGFELDSSRADALRRRAPATVPRLRLRCGFSTNERRGHVEATAWCASAVWW